MVWVQMTREGKNEGVGSLDTLTTTMHQEQQTTFRHGRIRALKLLLQGSSARRGMFAGRRYPRDRTSQADTDRCTPR